MPGGLMMEALAQTSTVLLLECATPGVRVYLRGVDNAKFRRQGAPGDRLGLEVTLGRRRRQLARVHGVAYMGEHVVAEADLLLELRRVTEIDSHAIVHPGAEIGEGTVVSAYATIGPNVRIGPNCRIGPSGAIHGWPTE